MSFIRVNEYINGCFVSVTVDKLILLVRCFTYTIDRSVASSLMTFDVNCISIHLRNFTDLLTNTIARCWLIF